MSTLIPFDDLNNPPFTPLSDAANGLRRLACDAYRAFPDQFAPTSAPGVGALRNAIDDFWDNALCPPPQSPPQTGFAPGCPVEYQLTVEGDLLTADDTVFSPADETFSVGFNVVRVTYETDYPQLTWIVTEASGSVRTILRNPRNYPRGGRWDIRSAVLSRVDGQPVNTSCDSPAEIEPDIIFPPIVNIPIGGDTYPIEINPVTFEIGGDTYFSPQFNTSLGPFEFSPIGVNVSPVFLPQIIPTVQPGNGGATPVEVDSIINSANNNQTNNLEVIVNNVSTTQTTKITENVRGDLQALADFIECLIERSDESLSAELLATATPGDVIPLPPNTFAVYVMLAAAPSAKTRVQAGSGDAPTVYYWGWYAIGQGGRFTSRHELHYQGQVVKVDRYQDSILVNPIYGNVARVVALIRTNDCQFTPTNPTSS